MVIEWWRTKSYHQPACSGFVVKSGLPPQECGIQSSAATATGHLDNGFRASQLHLAKWVICQIPTLPEFFAKIYIQLEENSIDKALIQGVLQEMPPHPLTETKPLIPLIAPTQRLGAVNLFRNQMRSARKLPLLSIPILENDKVTKSDADEDPQSVFLINWRSLNLILTEKSLVVLKVSIVTPAYAPQVAGKVWLELERGMNLLTMEFEDGRDAKLQPKLGTQF